MKTVQYGDWKIAVDIDKTKEYYRQYRINDTQANRNFAEYCKGLSQEEQSFFDDLGIDPVCCEIDHIGVDRKGNFPCGGYYFVCGSYLNTPVEKVVPLEDFLEMDPADMLEEDDRVDIGIFQFDFQCEDNLFKEIPKDMPEGFLCINFWCEDMKWLLVEDPEERIYEPPRFWEIRKIIKRKLYEKQYERQLTEESTSEFLQFFQELNIVAEPLNTKELKEYRKAWLTHFVPEGSNIWNLRQRCFPRGCVFYPWHLFSFEVLPYEPEDIANTRFDELTKPDCILMSNIDDIAFRLKHAGHLTARHIAQFEDVTITASDFSWTYSKTHEEDCGPYFYQK